MTIIISSSTKNGEMDRNVSAKEKSRREMSVTMSESVVDKES